jgi:hypothetical protein
MRVPGTERTPRGMRGVRRGAGRGARGVRGPEHGADAWPQPRGGCLVAYIEGRGGRSPALPAALAAPMNRPQSGRPRRYRGCRRSAAVLSFGGCFIASERCAVWRGPPRTPSTDGSATCRLTSRYGQAFARWSAPRTPRPVRQSTRPAQPGRPNPAAQPGPPNRGPPNRVRPTGSARPLNRSRLTVSLNRSRLTGARPIGSLNRLAQCGPTRGPGPGPNLASPTRPHATTAARRPSDTDPSPCGAVSVGHAVHPAPARDTPGNHHPHARPARGRIVARRLVGWQGRSRTNGRCPRCRGPGGR